MARARAALLAGALTLTSAAVMLPVNPRVALAAGTITEYSLKLASSPQGITLATDGNIWVTEPGKQQLARVTPGGAVTEYTTGVSSPFGIAQGPDNALWFTDQFGVSQIGRFSLSTLTVTNRYNTTTAMANPEGITAGPDGNLWFVEQAKDKVGKITTAGTVTEYTVLTAGSKSEAIAAGPDGNLWVAEYKVDKIAKVTTAGTVTEYPTLTAFAEARGITAGPDGNVWFTESLGERVGKITLGRDRHRIPRAQLKCQPPSSGNHQGGRR